MNSFGVGLSCAAVVGVVACASPENYDSPYLGSAAGRAAAGGSHVGAGGSGSFPSGGSSASGGPGSAGHPSQAGGAPSVGAGGRTGTGASGSAGTSTSSAGMGGTVGNAGSSGASPVFESGTCASGPRMSLSYQQASSNSKQITGRYQFSNTTDTPISLAQLKIRYFFSNEESSGWTTAIYDAKLEGGTGNYRPITGSALTVSPLGATVPGADSYLELSFSSTLSIEKGATGTVSWDLQPHNYNAPDQVQADDYSYNAAATTYTVWDHVVIYQADTLIWGCTPQAAGGSGGTSGAGGAGGTSGAGAGGASGSGTSGASGSGTGGASGSGASGANSGGASSGGASSGGASSGGASGAAAAGDNGLGGASGSSGVGGEISVAGASGSGSGSGGTST